MAMKTRKIVTEQPASREDLNLFLNEMKTSQAGLSARDSLRSARSAALASLARHDPAALNRLMVRAFLDMPKSASQKLGTMPTKRSGEPLPAPKKPLAERPTRTRKPKGEPR
jgi:hypothetical protein